MSTTEPASPTARTRVRRVTHRGRYDRTTLHIILNEVYVCHIAFADEHDVHYIPVACWRKGNYLYIHGSNGSHMLRLAGSGTQVCVVAMHLDGLVLARSAFNHSTNYRSAIIYGAFGIVPDAQRPAMLGTFMEALVPDCSQQARSGSVKELAVTTVLRILLDEAACKIRTGGPRDDAEDPELPARAGVPSMVLLPSLLVVQATPAEAPDCVWEWRGNARVPVGDVVMLQWL